ncbi:MAG: CapA family protein [Patescibacteria group bacterium]|jgi:poly-gamma-glutamate synthesis protein (capsule biosynthesis protein)
MPSVAVKIIWSLIILSVFVLAGLFLWPRHLTLNESFSWLAKYDFWSIDPPTGHLVQSPVVSPEPLKLLFFGDLMLDRHVGDKLAGRNLGYLLDGLATTSVWDLTRYDLVSVNLEGAVTKDGGHYSPDNLYDFAFSPSRISELKGYGFNFINLANNHFLDQGKRGVQETRQALTDLEFDYSGDIDAQVSSSSLAILDRGGQKIVLIGLSMVYQPFDQTAAQELIKDAQSSADLVVVNIHWGTEYQHQFNKTQQAVGRALVDAGADLVIGHHPHVVQGLEIYQNRPIFYSLGNFVFDQYFSPDTQTGLAVDFTISPTETVLGFFPLQSKASVVSLMTGSDKDNFFEQFIDWSSLDENQVSEVKSGRLVISR